MGKKTAVSRTRRPVVQRARAAPPPDTTGPGERDAPELLVRMLLHLREYPGTPRELDSTEHRIVASAVELFASRGYQATSMKDIAGMVGIKAPSIYAHFPSKDALLAEAVKWVLDDFIAFVTEPLRPEQSPREVLETLIKRHALYQVGHRSTIDAWHVLLEVDRLSQFLPDETREGVAAQRQLYHDLVEALVVNVFPGVDKPADRLRAVRVLCGRVGSWYSGADTEDPETAAEFVWSLAWPILGAGVTPR